MSSIKRRNCLKTTAVINVMGEPWQFNILTQKAYEKKHKDIPHASEGVTLKADRVIDFNEKIDLETIAHELKHAYRHYLCLTSTDELTLDDYEETECAWAEIHAFDFPIKCVEVLAEFVGRKRAWAEYKRKRKKCWS